MADRAAASRRVTAVHKKLLSLGFDNCKRSSPAVLKIGCSQCVVVSINGTPCHELGCPNQTQECAGCGFPIPRRSRLRSRLCESCAIDES